MEVRILKELNRQFVVAEPEEEIDMESYPVRMLAGSKIQGLLPCSIRTVNSKRAFYYDVTGCQALTQAVKGSLLCREELKKMMSDFLKTVEMMQSFLLDADQLYVSVEYLFFDREGLKLCCIPGYKKAIGEQFCSFVEYLLPEIDHNDREAVRVGYDVYRRALEEPFSMEEIREIIHKEPEETKQDRFSEKFDLEEDWELKEGWELPEEWEQKAENTGRAVAVRPLLLSLGWVVISLGICGAKFMGYLPFLTFPLLFGLLAAVLAALAVSSFLWERRKKNRVSRDEGRYQDEEAGGRQKPGYETEAEMNEKRRKKKSCARDKEDNERQKAKSLTKSGKDQEWQKQEPWTKVEENRGGQEPGSRMRASDDGEEQKKRKRAKATDRERQNTDKRMRAEINKDWRKQEPWNKAEEDRAEQEMNNTSLLYSLDGGIDGGFLQPKLLSREPEKFSDLVISKELTIIGKLAGSADAVIPLSTVSRIHARIRRIDGNFYLSDMNSKNGTKVNGTFLKARENYRLCPGDEIFFADAGFVFVF